MLTHCLYFPGYEWKHFEIPLFSRTLPGDLGKKVHACSLRFSAVKCKTALDQSARENSPCYCKICFRDLCTIQPRLAIFSHWVCLFQHLLVHVFVFCSLLKFPNFTYFACSSAIAISFSCPIPSNLNEN